MKLPELKYDSPVSFTFFQRIALALIPPVAAMLVRLFWRTCLIEFRGEEHLEKLHIKYRQGLAGFWHETGILALCTYWGTNFHTLASYSFDGELAARVMSWCGVEALRGSSSRGGSDALKELEKALQLIKGIGFTLDGPRGPRRVAKAGIAILSARTAVPILPVAFAVSPCWRMNSWDRFQVPKPFARIVCAYGPIIPPPTDNSFEAIEYTRLEIERTLNRIHDQIESEL